MVIQMPRIRSCLFALLSLLSVSTVSAGGLGAPSFGPDPSQILGGDEGDACEMQVCLSNPMGKGIKECDKALQKYAKLRDDEKPKYLEKCPKVMGGDKK